MDRDLEITIAAARQVSHDARRLSPECVSASSIAMILQAVVKLSSTVEVLAIRLDRRDRRAKQLLKQIREGRERHV